MNTIKNVMIAVDFTEGGKQVAKFGHSIARCMGATTTLVHVAVNPSLYAMDYTPVEGFSGMNLANSIAIGEEMHKSSDNQLQSLKNELGDEAVQAVTLDGEVESAIVDFAVENNVGLIVIGSHHKSGLERLFEGDLSQRLLSHTNLPVLMVPQETAGE